MEQTKTSACALNTRIGPQGPASRVQNPEWSGRRLNTCRGTLKQHSFHGWGTHFDMRFNTRHSQTCMRILLLTMPDVGAERMDRERPCLALFLFARDEARKSLYENGGGPWPLACVQAGLGAV
eukprot:6214364-Pleurochrysis_carterae.AAC.4